MPTKAPKPADLGTQGSWLWDQITTGYDLRPDEVQVLRDACREADLIERLELEQRDQSLKSRGSQGQEVASPLVSELRQHRSTLAGMLRGLKLPDSDAQAAQKAETDSQKARAAARARWDRKTVS